MKAKKVLTYFVIVVIACVCALNYELFVFPNSFAPAGLNGICTMIQYLFGISIGYLSLIINIPLALLVYFKVSKSLAIRSMVYIVTFSVAILVLDHVDLSRFYYATENGTSAILGPLVAGVIYGTCYSYLLKASAYSGGTDFVAALIHKVRPDKSVLGLIFTMNTLIGTQECAGSDLHHERHRGGGIVLCLRLQNGACDSVHPVHLHLQHRVRAEHQEWPQCHPV
jgi:uncharacterized membrane-anchored protein YitT (DUF2179 family)